MPVVVGLVVLVNRGCLFTFYVNASTFTAAGAVNAQRTTHNTTSIEATEHTSTTVRPTEYDALNNRVREVSTVCYCKHGTYRVQASQMRGTHAGVECTVHTQMQREYEKNVL